MQHVIIGLDTREMLSEMELTGPAEIDFGIEEIEDEDSELDDDNGDDDEEDEDDEDDDFAEVGHCFVYAVRLLEAI